LGPQCPTRPPGKGRERASYPHCACQREDPNHGGLIADEGANPMTGSRPILTLPPPPTSRPSHCARRRRRSARQARTLSRSFCKAAFAGAKIAEAGLSAQPKAKGQPQAQGDGVGRP
jgi:hypothetical protein